MTSLKLNRRLIDFKRIVRRFSRKTVRNSDIILNISYENSSVLNGYLLSEHSFKNHFRMSERRWLCDICGITATTFASLHRHEARRHSPMVRGVYVQSRTTSVIRESVLSETDSETIMSLPTPNETGLADEWVQGDNHQEEESGDENDGWFWPLPGHAFERESLQIEHSSQLSYALSSSADPLLPSDLDIAEADFPFMPDQFSSRL